LIPGRGNPPFSFGGEMELQKQSEVYGCVLTSVAMCMDIQVSDLRNQIDHDPHEVTWPNAIGPRKYRGIQIEDLLPVIYKKGYWAMPFFAKTYINGKVIDIPICYEALSHTGIFMYAESQHVVAWDGKQIYDPSGLIYQIKYGWEEFWIIESS